MAEYTSNTVKRIGSSRTVLTSAQVSVLTVESGCYAIITSITAVTLGEVSKTIWGYIVDGDTPFTDNDMVLYRSAGAAKSSHILDAPLHMAAGESLVFDSPSSGQANVIVNYTLFNV